MSLLLLPSLFLGLWIFLNREFLKSSGWLDLEERYRATHRPPGKLLRRQVYRFGAVRENGFSSLLASPQGLYIEPTIFGRPFHKALLIPWREVQKRQEGRSWWHRQWVEIELDVITTIRVSPRAYSAMAPYLQPLRSN